MHLPCTHHFPEAALTNITIAERTPSGNVSQASMTAVRSRILG